VPHPAVGKARRMQVSHSELQHEVMIEAVENHNPEVIVIDEIGREMEAMAARTIAERGVQLIGTAHGNALDNLMLNPTLSDLIGGIESVTLSDEEARRRGTQKTVLERRAPPTFDVLVEIQTRDRLVIHESVADAVDNILRRKVLLAEMRTRQENGEITIDTVQPEMRTITNGSEQGNRQRVNRNGKAQNVVNVVPQSTFDNVPAEEKPHQHLNIYAYGVARNRLQQSAKRLRVPVTVATDLGNADAVVTVKSYYRRRPKLIVDAEHRGMPIYVLRANTISQMENFLIDYYNLEANPLDPFGEAIREAETAIMQIRSGAEHIDLSPQEPKVRRKQHKIARKAQLDSTSYGKDPRRHVRIFSQEPESMSF
jgi:hypothetical protein